MLISVIVRHTSVDSLVDVESGLLRETLQAKVTLVRPLSGVRSNVYLQVRLASERRRTLQALEGSALHCGFQPQTNNFIH